MINDLEEQLCSQLYRRNGVSIQNCAKTLRSYRRYKERKAVKRFALNFLEEFLGSGNKVIRAFLLWESEDSKMPSLEMYIAKLVFDELKAEDINIEKYLRKRFGWSLEELPFY